MRGLSGKTAIVTGGATLIGRGVVNAFWERDVKVAVADIDEEGGAQLPDDVFFSATDIRDDVQIAQFVSAAAECFGGIDFLVNLATTYTDEGLRSPRSDWLDSLDVNAACPVMMAKSV